MFGLLFMVIASVASGTTCGTGERESRTHLFVRRLPVPPLRSLGEKLAAASFSYLSWVLLSAITILAALLTDPYPSDSASEMYRELGEWLQVPMIMIVILEVMLMPASLFFAAISIGEWTGKSLLTVILTVFALVGANLIYEALARLVAGYSDEFSIKTGPPAGALLSLIVLSLLLTYVRYRTEEIR